MVPTVYNMRMRFKYKVNIRFIIYFKCNNSLKMIYESIVRFMHKTLGQNRKVRKICG